MPLEQIKGEKITGDRLEIPKGKPTPTTKGGRKATVSKGA